MKSKIALGLITVLMATSATAESVHIYNMKNGHSAKDTGFSKIEVTSAKVINDQGKWVKNPTGEIVTMSNGAKQVGDVNLGNSPDLRTNFTLSISIPPLSPSTRPGHCTVNVLSTRNAANIKTEHCSAGIGASVNRSEGYNIFIFKK